MLLDGSFATLPDVVAEGRRVINNIERVANLFLVKTTYSMLLALAVGVIDVPFPFLPRHLTLVGSLTIGIPSFFLALAPNDRLAVPGFVSRVLHFAVPAGALAALVTFTGYALARGPLDLSGDQSRTMATLILTGAGLVVLVRLAQPFSAWRAGLVLSMIGLFALVLLLPAGQEFFALELPPAEGWAVVAGLVFAFEAGWRLLRTRVAALRLDGWTDGGSAVLGVREVEAAAGVPLRALVAVGGDAAGVLQHPGQVQQVPGHEGGVAVGEVVLGTAASPRRGRTGPGRPRRSSPRRPAAGSCSRGAAGSRGCSSRSA